VSIARILLFAAVTLAYATLSFAQNSSASPTPPLDPQRLKSIDSFIATQMAKQKIPGLAVGIYSLGQILLAKGYGQANVDGRCPVAARPLGRGKSGLHRTRWWVMPTVRASRAVPLRQSSDVRSRTGKVQQKVYRLGGRPVSGLSPR